MIRNAVGQASKAYDQATDTATGLGANASAIGSNVTPFLTEEMLHPQGVGQAGLSAETAAAEGGAGGAASAFTGEAAQRAAASHNAGGYQAALDDMARSRMKAAAGASEGIAANNENLKERQSQEGAAGLEKMYGVDTSGMLDAMGQESKDINSEVDANNSGWLQNTVAMINALANGAKGVGAMRFGGG